MLFDFALCTNDVNFYKFPLQIQWQPRARAIARETLALVTVVRLKSEIKALKFGTYRGNKFSS